MNNRIIFMGTPAFAAASLDALLAARMEVAAVVTAPDRPAGRGLKLRMSAVKERAVQAGLPVLQPTNLKDPAFLGQLDALDASLYIVVAFRMLPEAVWRKPPLGTVNLHASLLPNYRGAAPINWALINGEARTGVTTFLINAQIDTGDILLREPVHISPEDNAGTLHDRLMHTGADLLVRTAKDIMDGTATPISQADHVDDQRREAPKLSSGNCRIQWAASADHVHNHVRGLSPHPGAWTHWKTDGQPDRLVKILSAKPLHGHGKHQPPGTVDIAGERLLVHCGNGALEVLQLQMQDKRAMDAASFIRGMQQRSGLLLG